jgi:hypothetical protein
VLRELEKNMQHQRYRRRSRKGIQAQPPWKYSPHLAQLRADKKASRPKTAKLAAHPRLRAEVEDRLKHKHSPEQVWRQFGVTVQASERARTALTLHTFHVLQVAPGDPDVDAGLPARGLSGEGYCGHIFWDEIFVHPILTLRQPAITRARLLYRYRRLGAARGGCAGSWPGGGAVSVAERERRTRRNPYTTIQSPHRLLAA